MQSHYLQEMLQREAEQVRVRFCMPGHKGLLGKTDLTETPGMDNLAHPEGTLLDVYARAAQAYDAQAVRFSVNGSTAGVIAMLCAAVREHEKVIIARDCHLSVASALAIGGQIPVYLPPAFDVLPQPPAKAAIAQAIAANPDAKAVFLTYPNYYGLCCPLQEIADLCHQHGMALLVDAAHAAHFAFSELLPPSPSCADAWVMSAHKTLMATNQAAILCLGKHSLLEGDRLFGWLSRVQTTSPSWPTLQSIDAAVSTAVKLGEQQYAQLLARIDAFYQALPATVQPVCCENQDPTRIVLRVQDGYQTLSYLYTCGIAVEMADAQHIVLITTPVDLLGNDFFLLAAALDTLPDFPQADCVATDYAFETACTPRQAVMANACSCALQESEGFVAASVVTAYPPGTAILMPGDRITASQIACITRLEASGASLTGMHLHQLPIVKGL